MTASSDRMKGYTPCGFRYQFILRKNEYNATSRNVEYICIQKLTMFKENIPIK
jgi:hypothetical protein